MNEEDKLELKVRKAAAIADALVDATKETERNYIDKWSAVFSAMMMDARMLSKGGEQ